MAFKWVESIKRMLDRSDFWQCPAGCKTWLKRGTSAPYESDGVCVNGESGTVRCSYCQNPLIPVGDLKPLPYGDDLV